MGISLLELLNTAAAKSSMSKSEFGRIMHDPNATDKDRDEALKIMQDAGGYENLAD